MTLDTRFSSRRRLAGTVVIIFLLSRLIFAVFGLRLDASTALADEDFQLLQIDQLRHHLVSSIWNLNSQPPLFNVATGALLHLPHGAIRPVMYVVGWGMGAALSVITLYLCLDLGLSRPVALALTVVVTLDPANLLYQNWYFYSYPTALLLAFAALALTRYVRSRTWGWGMGFFASAAGLVLLNSTFQWFWLVGALVAAFPIAWRHSRRHWRQVLGVASVPVLVVGFWYTKNVALFGTTTTSGWTGMNLARITTMAAPKDEVRHLIVQHRLSPLAGLVAFQPLAYYPPQYQENPHTGEPVLDRPTKPNGAANFNDPEYIKLSNAWLRDDLRYIKIDPGQYMSNVERALRVYTVPAEQYQFLIPNAGRIQDYARAFDLVVDWQPVTTHTSTINTEIGNGVIPSPGQLAWGVILCFGLVFLGVPILAWSRRRDFVTMSPLMFIWFSCLYVTLITSFTELGENERFRFDLGPLPLITAVVVAGSLFRGLRGRRERLPGQGPRSNASGARGQTPPNSVESPG